MDMNQRPQKSGYNKERLALALIDKLPSSLSTFTTSYREEVSPTLGDRMHSYGSFYGFHVGCMVPLEIYPSILSSQASRSVDRMVGLGE
jgi:hypothetical protein